MNVTGVNPSSELDYGTWIQRGQGRVLIGFDATDPDYDAVGDVVGSKTHKHDDHPALQHNGTSITDHAIHKHPAGTLVDSTVTGSRKGGTSGAATLTDSHGHTITGNTGNPSGTLTHSVTQPSEHAVQSHSEVNHMPAGFIVYIWERTT